MFVNKKKLCALMKEAYNSSGLRVGDLGETYVLEMKGACIEIDKKKLSKEVKAKIIELAGELPDLSTGENGYQATKGEALQYEMFGQMNEVWKRATDLRDVVEITFGMVETNKRTYRLVRTPFGEIKLINKKYTDLMMGEKLDEDESLPAGPLYDKWYMYYWNNSMAIRLPLAYTEKERLSGFCKDVAACGFRWDDERTDVPEE